MVDNSGSSFSHDSQFLRVDDASVIKQFGLYPHQPSRHVVADGKDQIDIQVIRHAGFGLSMIRRKEFIGRIFCGGGGIELTVATSTNFDALSSMVCA
jgi:hypothetical protein